MPEQATPRDRRYPGKRFTAAGESCYVQTAEDEAALGPGWSDSTRPAAKPAPATRKRTEKE